MRLPRTHLGLLTLVFVVSLPAVTTRIYASDEIQYFAYLRSLWFDRDLSFENEYRYFYDRGIAASPGFHETFLERTTDTGRRVTFAPLGTAILWAPFYAVADVGVRAARAMGSGVEADGFSHPYIAAVCYASAVYGLLAILLSIEIARLVIGRGTAAALLVWCGTPLIFYMYVAVPWSHAPSAFAVSAFILVWLKVRRDWPVRGMAALGALAALMTMVREQDAFFVVGPAIDFLWRANRRSWVGVGAGAAAFAATFLPQAIAYQLLHGRVGPSPMVARKMIWTTPHALEVLFSPEHGFIWWTPMALLSIAGLVWLARPRGPASGFRLQASGSLLEATGIKPDNVTIRTPEARPAKPEAVRDVSRIALCCLAMFAAQVYIAGSVDSWHVAGAFGQRRFVALTPLLTLGLAALLASVHGRRAWWLRAACALAVWWNLGLIAQYGTGMMDRQRLEPGRNAYNTFVVLPRTLPTLAYRYVFDRSSFYQPTPWEGK